MSAADRPPGSAGSPTASLVGDTVAHFRVRSRLGEGGMGVVYRAEDERLGRQVALKVLPDAFAGDHERRKRFVREARVAAGVNDPNLATIYEVGEFRGRVYLAMELVLGSTLRERLEVGPLPPAEATRVAHALATGLRHAHDLGIVHRDLKPENVMLTAAGGVKILDFGLAKLDRPEGEGGALAHQETQTQEGLVLGTPGYMSPEQASGRTVDARSDVYALGIVLHEMLTGELPASFMGGARLPDPGLEAILARCLAPAPEHRWSHAGEVADALGALTSAPARPPRGRLRRRTITLVVALTAAGAAALAVASRHSSEPAPVAPAAPVATRLTDLPLPASAVPEARSEYASAIQALHDDSFVLARRHLARAAQLDPAMAAAHLRLAMTMAGPSPGEATKEFSAAVSLRAQLGERDRALLEALEPAIARSHKDYPLARARLRAASQRFPLDVELLDWIAILRTPGSDEALAAARRASQLDPRDGQAWENLGTLLALEDHLDEAQAALEHGASLSIDSGDCRTWLAEVEAARGRCADFARDAQRVSDVERDPALLARAAAAVGRPESEVRELLRQDVVEQPEDERALVQAVDDRRLAVLYGRFDEAAAALAREGRVLASTGANDYTEQLRFHTALAQVRLELGDAAGARAIARAFEDRSETWIRRATDVVGDTDSSALLGRLASPDARQWQAKRGEWTEERLREGASPGLVWALGWAAPALTPDEAVAAIRGLDEDPRLRPPRGGEAIIAPGIPDAYAGRAYLLAGRPAEALPFLRRAAALCPALGELADHEHAVADLGRALELTGDRAGACEAYGRVLGAWGRPVTRSITVAAAREGVRRLRCGP